MVVKIGICGLGHLGKIHHKCIEQIPTLELVGVYDPDPSALQGIEGDLICHSFEALLDRVDAVDIVAPTSVHAALAAKALSAGRHLFIEKPVTSTPEEAQQLLDLQKTAQRVIQVGHVERFNPALMSISDMSLDPRFMEVHRLAPFNPRGTDVSVVLDLMIHDLDILLSLVSGHISDIRANGVAIVSETVDIANARIEWDNGCIANVTASRVSLKNMRRMRMFQSDAYVVLDFLDRSAQVIQMVTELEGLEDETVLDLDTPTGTKHVHIKSPQSPPVNAIQMELEQFAASVINGTKPAVGLQEGYAALKLAYQIDSLINKGSVAK